MMKLMNKKLTKKGFTLAELLIVVAILAILVAVSIPIFTSKLHDAKDATDVANVRSAKAAAVVNYMSAADLEAAGASVTYWYDAENGKAIKSESKPTALTKGYNKCTTAGCANDPKKGSGKDKADEYAVKVVISDSGATVTTTWEKVTD